MEHDANGADAGTEDQSRVHDGNGNILSGHVRVFVWNGSQWIQRGENLNGEYEGENFGASIALLEDGTVLAVGADNPWGVARVFVWNGLSWVQRGSDLGGVDLGGYFGHVVALSGDGNVLGVGAYGHVRMFV